jgi:F-type H+-transporting ATPase subunit b
MSFDWWTLALQTVNFLVLAWLLQHFLYRPVLAAIDRRRAETDSARARATEAERRAEAAEADWRRRGDELESERVALRRQSETEAARRGEEVVAGARLQAERLLVEARATMATERDAAADILGRRAAEVATVLAGRLLADAAPGVGAAPFVDLLINRLGGLDAAERAAFAVDGLRLELAPAGSEAERQTAAGRVAKALGGMATIATAEAPELIAGARLSAAAAVLEVSWAATLATAQREMANHEHPG